jgi:hypothetical protein
VDVLHCASRAGQKDQDENVMRAQLPAVLLALLIPLAAGAECHLKAQTVVMCQSPKNAALAYNEFGLDQAKIGASYNRELLHESWCAVVSDDAHSLRFERISSGRIATPAGWVTVLDVNFFHDGINDERYVAAGYVSGTCENHTSNADAQPGSTRSPYLPSMPPGGCKIRPEDSAP